MKEVKINKQHFNFQLIEVSDDPIISVSDSVYKGISIVTPITVLRSIINNSLKIRYEGSKD